MTLIVIASAAVLGAVTVAFVLYPVFRASALGRRYVTDSVTGDRLAELIARRDAIYEAIRDADFDRETGKLTEEDHRLMRERLTAEGVKALQELDRLMQSDVREELEEEIEREVVALRGSRSAEAVEKKAVDRGVREPIATRDVRSVTCHACGSRVRADARFCTHCGASLALTCLECGASVEADDQFCGSCGAKLTDADKVTEVAVDSVD